ncbi:hypothetical protein DSECCO2_619950 [anaerobic digester metagenome]
MAGEFVGEAVARVFAHAEGDERLDDVPFQGIGFPDDRGLRHRIVRDERALDLRGPDVVPGDDDQVVGPAEDHDVAVLVLHREVSCSVAARDGLPVGAVARIVPVDRPEHGRPGLPDDQEPPGAGRDRLTRPVDDIHDGARYGSSGKPGFHRLADHRGDDVHTGLGLPPGIHDRALSAADPVVVPLEGLGVEGFADGAEHAQR